MRSSARQKQFKKNLLANKAFISVRLEMKRLHKRLQSASLDHSYNYFEVILFNQLPYGFAAFSLEVKYILCAEIY